MWRSWGVCRKLDCERQTNWREVLVLDSGNFADLVEKSADSRPSLRHDCTYDSRWRSGDRSRHCTHDDTTIDSCQQCILVNKLLLMNLIHTVPVITSDVPYGTHMNMVFAPLPNLFR